jgi:uncharacterized membrane protein
MQTQCDIDTHAPSEVDAREIVAQLLAERRRARRGRATLPRWARVALRVLPRLLLVVTLANLAIGLLAVVAPLLRATFGADATAWLYSAYALICPQRPSHTTFIAGEPMAMEERMVAMYLAFGLVGLLYPCWGLLRRPLPTWGALLGVAPAVIDVAMSSTGIRASTTDSRYWTGALASAAVVWWAYPRFEAMLRAARSRVDAA